MREVSEEEDRHLPRARLRVEPEALSASSGLSETRERNLSCHARFSRLRLGNQPAGAAAARCGSGSSAARSTVGWISTTGLRLWWRTPPATLPRMERTRPARP